MNTTVETTGGKERSWKRAVKNLIIAVLCVIFIVCLSVTLTLFSRWIYYFDINNLNIPETSGYSAEVCRTNYDILIDYNVLTYRGDLEFPDFPMSEQGRTHFAEAKQIFVAAQWVTIAGIIAFVLRILWQRHRRDNDFRWMKMTMWICIGIVVIVGATVAINWDMAFELMHTLLFNNDFWLFDPKTDPVIKILPDSFFMHCGIVIMILAVIFVILCRVLCRVLEKHGKTGSVSK